MDNFENSKDLSKLRGISVGALNVRSVYRKIDDIHVLLSRSDLSILSISESWLNSSVANCEIELPGYKLVRFDRDNGTGFRGGGVSCFIRNEI